jgi:hypothetical protein
MRLPVASCGSLCSDEIAPKRRSDNSDMKIVAIAPALFTIDRSELTKAAGIARAVSEKKKRSAKCDKKR